MTDQTDMLYVEWKILARQWTATQDNWKDHAAIKFDRDCWRDFENVATNLLQAMQIMDDKMEDALSHVR